MSNQENPNSGYVVPAKQIATVFRPGSEQRAKFEQFIEEDNELGLRDWLWAGNWSSYLPHVVDVYIPRDTDTVEEPMKVGEMYIVFDEEELFEKTPSEKMTRLQSYAIEPEKRNWSVWG